MGFDFRASQIEDDVATAATFLSSCVAQALSHADEPRHSLHIWRNAVNAMKI